MSSLKNLLSKHHVTCDDHFAAAEKAADAGDWAGCTQSASAFAKALAQHFAAEEELLFPAFEQATGMSAGPTMIMRSEHVQMRALLDSLLAAADGRSADDFFGASETLLVFMEQHNRKEEGILYPMCDQSIPESSELAASIAPMLEP